MAGNNLIDLSFLTDAERSAILKVIEKDILFHKEALSSLECSVENDRKLQRRNSSGNSLIGTGAHGACSCCGTNFVNKSESFCCFQCNYLVCKQCSKKGMKQIFCTICYKERHLEFLSEDEQLSSSSPSQSTHISGSQLIQRSLSLVPEITKTEPDDTPPLKSILSQRSSLLQVPTHATGKKKKSVSLAEFKSQSLEISRTTTPPMRERSSSFTVIKSASSDSDLDEVSSLYSESCFEANSWISGSIKLGIWYKNNEGILYVNVVMANGLHSENGSACVNPYVKVYLLPGRGKQNKRRTGIQRKTNSPLYNEVVKYKIDREKLGEHTLWISVWDWTILGRSKFLGEIQLPLSSLDLSVTESTTYKLKDHKHIERIGSFNATDSASPNPKICIALKFAAAQYRSPFRSRTPSPSEDISSRSLQNSPTSSQSRDSITPCELGTLCIRVKRAENLTFIDFADDTNPFVRCYLLPNVHLRGKRKSSVVPSTVNPVWDDEFSYKLVYLEDLKTERALEVTVWDMDRRGTNSFMGCVRLGPNPLTLDQTQTEDWMDSFGEEVMHWEEMLARPGEWVERWHTLRPSSESLRKDKKRIQRCSPDGSERLGSVDSGNSMEDSDIVEILKPKLKGTSDSKTTDTDTMKKVKSSPVLDFSVARRPKGNHYEITGEVEFSIHYREVFYGTTLTVHIIGAKDLAAADKSTSSSNPYVKMYLLPNTREKRKTKVKKRTVNPVFKQSFDFSITGKKMMKQCCLWITVWSHEAIQHNQFLGETWLKFDSYDLDNPVKEQFTLKLYDLLQESS